MYGFFIPCGGSAGVHHHAVGIHDGNLGIKYAEMGERVDHTAVDINVALFLVVRCL